MSVQPAPAPDERAAVAEMIRAMRSSLVCGCCVVIALAAIGAWRATSGTASAVARSAPAGRLSSARPSPAAGRPVAHSSEGSAARASHPTRKPLAPAAATAAFGLDLLPRLGSGNVVFSPDSIAAALAMTGTGAAGRTATQIAEVLRVGSPAALPAVGRLQGTIAAEQAAAARGNPQPPELEVANGLFVQQGYALQPAFLSGLQQNFGAAPTSVDFMGNTAGAVAAINAWISTHTKGLIPHILSSLSAETRLALANAIYLKAAWRFPFKAAATGTGSFHGEHGSAATPFMHETEQLGYVRGRGYEALDLPYSGSTLSLLVVLPVGQSVASLQRRLDAAPRAGVLSGLRPRPVNVSLPRFHIALQLSLNGPLQALEMTDAFTPAANFSRIATGEQLQIGQVEHAADFTVQEAGTIAAAATVVTIEATAERGPVQRPIAFDADRPFLFFLRDDRSGAVLFGGRLSDPAAATAPASG